MIRFITIFFLSYLLQEVSCQTITGYISDERTKKKITQAVIYFDGTFHHTVPDIQGNFTFDISGFPLMPVTVSSPGYYSVTFEAVPSIEPVEILMKPKATETVKSSDSEDQEEARKQNLKQFKNIILGKSNNALSCEIINENDIIFIKDKDTLKACSSDPLIIQNNALGYKSIYYLDDFVLNTKDESFLYSGNVLFKEDLAKIEGSNKKNFKNRGEAFLNSKTYFFRLLWADQLDSAGFIVKNPMNEDLFYKDIVTDKGVHGKYLKHYEKMKSSGQEFSTYIVFLESEAIFDAWGRLDVSCITEITLRNDVYFDRKGYFNHSEIEWRGKLSRQGIADQLPLEFNEIVKAKTQYRKPTQHLTPHSGPSHLTPNSFQNHGRLIKN